MKTDHVHLAKQFLDALGDSDFTCIQGFEISIDYPGDRPLFCGYATFGCFNTHAIN